MLTSGIARGWGCYEVSLAADIGRPRSSFTSLVQAAMLLGGDS
jgi:hypothetical protein